MVTRLFILSPNRDLTAQSQFGRHLMVMQWRSVNFSKSKPRGNGECAVSSPFNGKVMVQSQLGFHLMER